MCFHERLKQARTDAGYTQAQAANLLQQLGCPVKSYVLSSWERGKHKPDVEQLAALCRVYRADAAYLLCGIPRDEDALLLHGLNEDGRRHALQYLALLRTNPLFASMPSATAPPAQGQIIRLYDLPVSAGSGTFLDDEHYEEIPFGGQIPAGTDYALRVSGNSMEPVFHHGQVLFVKAQQTLHDGEIGIFSRNGEAYVKKLKNNSLVSLNPAYAPIQLLESDTLQVLGKVLGTD